MSRWFRVLSFSLIFAFCVTVGMKFDRPPQIYHQLVEPLQFKEVTRRCVISGRYIGIYKGYVYVDSPKDGLVRVKLSPKSNMVFHDYNAHQRKELNSIQDLRGLCPDAVTLGVNGVIEDAIFAITE